MMSLVVGSLVRVTGWVSTALARRFRGDVDVGTSRFPRRLQWDGWSCGSRSVQAIALHFRRDVSHDEVKAGVGTTTGGTATTPIVRYLRKLGLRAGHHRRMSFGQLVRALERGGVVLVDIRGLHWSVVHGVNDEHVWLANPSLKQLGRRISTAKFRALWTGLGVIVSDRPSRPRQRAPR